MWALCTEKNMMMRREHPTAMTMLINMAKLYKTVSLSLPLHRVVGYPIGPKPNPPDKNDLFRCWEVEFSFCLWRFTAKSAIMVIMGTCGSKIPNMMQVIWIYLFLPAFSKDRAWNGKVTCQKRVVIWNSHHRDIWQTKYVYTMPAEWKDTISSWQLN